MQGLDMEERRVDGFKSLRMFRVGQLLPLGHLQMMAGSSLNVKATCCKCHAPRLGHAQPRSHLLLHCMTDAYEKYKIAVKWLRDGVGKTHQEHQAMALQSRRDWGQG